MVEATSMPQSLTDPRWASPQICRPNYFWLVFLVVEGIAAFSGGMAGFVYWGVLGYGPSPSGVKGRIALAVCTLGLTTLGIYLVLGALKYRVLLDKNAITLVGIISNRTLLRTDIAAKLVIWVSGIQYVTLYALQKHKKKLTIAFMYDKNDAIRSWVADIPDLSRDHRPETPIWLVKLRERLRRRKYFG